MNLDLDDGETAALCELLAYGMEQEHFRLSARHRVFRSILAKVPPIAADRGAARPAAGTYGGPANPTPKQAEEPSPTEQDIVAIVARSAHSHAREDDPSALARKVLADLAEAGYEVHKVSNDHRGSLKTTAVLVKRLRYALCQRTGRVHAFGN